MTSRAGWVLVSVLVMVACYHVPWVVHETAGFTMHAFDLAEWSSLHPAVRGSSPAMLTSFLLRAPLWAIVFAVALTANAFEDVRLRWLVRAGALLLAVRFVPPKEFFTSAGDDPNYRQMGLFTALSGASVVVAVVIAWLPRRVQSMVFAFVVAGGVVASWWGVSRVGELFDNFEIDVWFGMGLYGYSVFALLALLRVVWRFGREAETQSRSTVPARKVVSAH